MRGGHLSTTGIILFSALAMRLASAPTANFSYLLLAGYSLLGRAQAIQALALSWLFTMLSPGVGPSAALGAVGRYAVITAAALSILLRSGLLQGRIHLRKPVAATLLLGAFFIVHSLLVSPVADVSILKSVSWTVVMATLLSAWLGLSVSERDQLTRQIFIGLTILLVASLPLAVLPLGYLRNGSGFQGLLNHPQAFGPTMALLGAWAAGQMFSKLRPSWGNIGLVGACLGVVLLSEARTAGLALVLAVSISIFTAPWISGASLRWVLPGLRSKRVWLVLGMIIMLSIVIVPSIVTVAHHYISKSGRAENVSSILGAYEESRGGLMEQMWNNITENSIVGIGFGIASHPSEMVVERDPLLGLPVSASIEKGVMPLAILEEVGIVGLFIFLTWLCPLLLRIAKNGVTSLAVALTALLLNMGEYTFFSPGGLGMLLLILFSWSCSKTSLRVDRERF